jgi:lipopolysaccharide/colanic/teichoic acid biosynthesis glycosyltransferase
LLDHRSFEFSTECERMRVDRNGSRLSVLLLTFPQGATTGDALERVTEVFEARLRITDTVGQLRDGRIGVLLPDTPRSGACHVAESLCNRLDGSLYPLAWEVVVYPDDTHVAVEVDAEKKEVDVAARVLRSNVATLFVRPTPVMKRAVDILASAIGLLVTAPLLAVTAVAIKLTSTGPVFFRQRRDGLGGKPFVMVKFRTMYDGAEARKAGLLHLSEQDGPAFKMTEDPRVTPLGRFLRRTCIDELPQLWHVLCGEMTLVGPRPMDSEESRECAPWQRRRLDVAPGVTCSWQVLGGPEVSFADWMRMDLRYISRRSLWQDTKLICQTLLAVVFHRASV